MEVNKQDVDQAREMLQGYKLNKEQITLGQVSEAINELTEYLENKLKEKLDDNLTK